MCGRGEARLHRRISLPHELHIVYAVSGPHARHYFGQNNSWLTPLKYKRQTLIPSNFLSTLFEIRLENWSGWLLVIPQLSNNVVPSGMHIIAFEWPCSSVDAKFPAVPQKWSDIAPHIHHLHLHVRGSGEMYLWSRFIASFRASLMHAMLERTFGKLWTIFIPVIFQYRKRAKC